MQDETDRLLLIVRVRRAAKADGDQPLAIGVIAVTRRLDRPAAATPAAWRSSPPCGGPRRGSAAC